MHAMHADACISWLAGWLAGWLWQLCLTHNRMILCVHITVCITFQAEPAAAAAFAICVAG
jgi:hypothetical protein